MPVVSDGFMTYAVEQFKLAIGYMVKNNTALHAFDFKGTKDGKVELWTIVILIGRKRDIDKLIPLTPVKVVDLGDEPRETRAGEPC